MESNVQGYEDKSTERVITKKDLNKMAWRSLFLQASFNYERMQACGWLYGLLPGLKKIHKNKKDLSNSMKDHMGFFNTHPFLVTFIMGIVIAMEENKTDRDAIRSIKVATMGPLGGIGDSLFWMTLIPIAAGIGASFAQAGSILGAILFFIVFNIVQFGLKFGLIHYSYKTGIKAISKLKESTKKISRAASIVALTVLGALIPFCVKVESGVILTAGKAKVPLQSVVFDGVLLKIIPLAYSLLMYKLVKKGWSPMKLVMLTVVVGVICNQLNLLVGL